MLKVHRAYRFISKSPQCDRYVLCELNAAALEQQQQQESKKSTKTTAGGLIAGVSPKIVKIGSMGAAIFISTETGTPFWTLFGVINAPYNCEVSIRLYHNSNCCYRYIFGICRLIVFLPSSQAKYPVDCAGFHEGEAKVTTEYVHNEL